MKAAFEDLTSRRPVWVALSELFLDMELEAADLQRVGRTLAACPYTLKELEDILFGEVYPVCIWNLRTLDGGNFVGFDADLLEEAILKHERSRFKIPTWLQCDLGSVRKPWKEIQAVVHERRNENPSHDTVRGT
jgi:hypothetical protein